MCDMEMLITVRWVATHPDYQNILLSKSPGFAVNCEFGDRSCFVAGGLCHKFDRVVKKTW